MSPVRKPLRIRGGADDAFVENLSDLGVKNQVELEKWRRMGLSKRATAATLVNELSSRSHAIFCIKVQRELSDGRVVVARCFFVDLAGSERLHSSGDHLISVSFFCWGLEYMNILYIIGIHIYQQVTSCSSTCCRISRLQCFVRQLS